MKKIAFLLAFFIVSTSFSQSDRFKDEIAAFQKEDSLHKPKDGIILFIGSSSFRLWKNVKEDLHNTTILNRAFGGATLGDLIYYKRKVIMKYNPKKIVMYCGENDIANSPTMTPDLVRGRFVNLFEQMRFWFPEAQIIFVSIKPAISRWDMRDRMIESNRLIKEYISKQKLATYVDIWDKMLENGEPRKDIFLEDNLHMNAKGYAIWSKELAPLINN